MLDLILQLIQRWQLIHRLRRCLPKPGSEGWQVVFHIQWLAHIALLLVQIAHQIKNASSVFKEYFDHGAGQGTINTWRRRNSSSVSLGLRTSLYPLLSRVTCYRCGIHLGHVGEYLTTSTNVSALIQIQRVNVWCLHQHCWLELVIGKQVTTKTQCCSKKPCATHHAIILMTTSSGCLPTDISFLHLRSLPQIGQSVLVWKGQTCPQLCKTLMKPVASIASIKTSWEERRHKQSSVAVFEFAPMEWACDIVCILSCGCGNIKGWPWLQERNQKLKTSHQNCFDLYFAHHNLEYLPITY